MDNNSEAKKKDETLDAAAETDDKEVKEEKEIVDTEYQFTHEYMAKGENGYYLCIGSFLF